MDFLVTGCGRSGTNYVAERLNSSGILCGHEEVFTLYGPVEDNYYTGDSSWFAPPFMNILAPKFPVLHIVRNPVKVVNSFYRIGACAQYGWRQFAVGRSLLGTLWRYHIKIRKIVKRYNYVKAHRRFLRTYTSCMTEANEIDRLWCYWYQWNKLIEKKATQFNLNYLRVPLENIDEFWPDITDFLKIKATPVPGTPVNTKNKYRRSDGALTPPPQKVIDLANKYGYRDIDLYPK